MFYGVLFYMEKRGNYIMTKEIMDQNQIKRSLIRISYEIIEKLQNPDELTLLGIKSRGESLAKTVAQLLEQNNPETKINLYDLDVRKHRDDDRQEDVTNDIPKDAIDNKTVILIDDVLFSGRTIRAALDSVSEIGRAKRICLAVLVDRGHRELPIRPDFIGKNIPTSINEHVQLQLGDTQAVILN